MAGPSVGKDETSMRAAGRVQGPSRCGAFEGVAENSNFVLNAAKEGLSGMP